MKSPSTLLACISISVCIMCAGCGSNDSARTYDLVLEGGRVMDPESGLDAVRNVGITDGHVEAITEAPLSGTEMLDVSGLVVAPGFIDLHSHGQDYRSFRLKARDGVTTALELEEGVYPVAEWYTSQKGQALINYGATVGHIPVRIKLRHGINAGNSNSNTSWHAIKNEQHLIEWAMYDFDEDEVTQMLAMMEAGLGEGALGIGLAHEYTPGADREEIFRLFQLSAEHGVPVFVHVRHGGVDEPYTGVGGMQEVIADAAVTGSPLHIVHITSMAGTGTSLVLEMIESARRRGLDITTEAYPYTAWSAPIESAWLGSGWQEMLGITYGDLQWVETGERLTEETFSKYREQGGLVIGHGIPEDAVDLAVRHPLVAIASDGGAFITGGEHPRGAGTFARVLGHYVREMSLLTLMDALRKMTLMPAQRLESFAPQMQLKGRIREGADADITIFDPEKVIDIATFGNSEQASQGIVHVLVGGTFIVRDEEVVEGVYPGHGVRSEPKTKSP